MPYDQWPYLTVLAVLLACSLGLPLPEDVPLLTGGYMCQRGMANPAIMIAIGLVGVLTGDILLFCMGRRFGHQIVEHRFVRRLVNPQRLLMAEQLFKKHGVKIIFVGRFLPGLRPMIFMASGVLRVPFLAFLAVNGAAACISVPTLVVVGKLFGSHLEQLKGEVRAVTHTIALIIIVAALSVLGVYLHRRQKSMMASTRVTQAVDAKTLAHLPPGGVTDEHQTANRDSDG